MKRRISASILLLALLFSLCACGRKNDTEDAEAAGIAGETAEGWIPSRIAFPNWLARSTGWETDGDAIYLSGMTPENQLVAASYDTLSGEWQRIDFTIADAYHPQLGCLSYAGHSLWGLLEEGPSREDLDQGRWRDDLGYYVLHIDLTSGESTAVRIPFEGEGSTEGSGLFFSGILGLDDGRALLGRDGSLLCDRRQRKCPLRAKPAHQRQLVAFPRRGDALSLDTGWLCTLRPGDAELWHAFGH